MRTFIDNLREALRARSAFSKSGCVSSIGWGIALLSLACAGAIGQSPAPQPDNPPAQSSAPAPAAPTDANPTPANVSSDSTGSKTTPGAHESADKNPTLHAGSFSIQTIGGEIKEDQLKQMLIGKALYLRAGYLDNNLNFDEQGQLTGHSPQGSFTLSQIQVNKLKLSKHKLELEGDRYGLHFLGAAPYEDPTKATDRVKITPKKKTVRISFDREQVEIPKKKKERHKDKQKDDLASSNLSGKSQPAADTGDNSAPSSGTVKESTTPQVAETTADDRSNGKKETTTTSPAHASQLLLTALDKVFSLGIDDRVVAAMPDFWKLYYQAAEAKADIKPVGAGIFSANNVDQKAKLISVLDPSSNEFAQTNGVAGIAMYHAIIGADGKVEAVVAGRPIGFGLDENAEQAIRKATFQAAMKDGKPVPVVLDLVVSFRIYSKRTSAAPAQEAAEEKPGKSALPGPYTLQDEEAARAAQQNQSAQPQQTPSTPQ